MRFSVGIEAKGTIRVGRQHFGSTSTGRTMVRNAWPSRFRIAASATRWSVDSDARRASKTTFPLDSTVLHVGEAGRLEGLLRRSAIFAFIGLTPRRNAA